jgi:glutaredoxin
MKPKLTLYSRKDCGLCAEMKEIIGAVGTKIPLELEEIDVDGSPQLQKAHGHEVPVLFIDGRKAFKFRLAAKDLEKKLKQKPRPFFAGLARVIGKGSS